MKKCSHNLFLTTHGLLTTKVSLVATNRAQDSLIRHRKGFKPFGTSGMLLAMTRCHSGLYNPSPARGRYYSLCGIIYCSVSWPPSQGRLMQKGDWFTHNKPSRSPEVFLVIKPDLPNPWVISFTPEETGQLNPIQAQLFQLPPIQLFEVRVHTRNGKHGEILFLRPSELEIGNSSWIYNAGVT